jgi:exopolysaccharide production protein ExoZ
LQSIGRATRLSVPTEHDGRLHGERWFETMVQIDLGVAGARASLSKSADTDKDGSVQPQTGRKLAGIEAGRGVASVFVVLYHAANHMKLNVGFAPLGGFAQFGHAGVDFFFVLSGFIIYFVHSRDIGQRERLAHYAERRFTRIYPFYWFVFALGLGLTSTLSSAPTPAWTTAIYNLTLLPTNGEPWIGVAWTLQHELLFYAIFAIAIAHGRIGKLVFALWLAAIVADPFFAISANHGAFADKLLSSFNIEFFFGIFAAWLTLSKRVTSTLAFLVAGVVCFAAVGILEDVGLLDGYAPYARLAYGLSSMLVVIGLTAVRLTTGLMAKIFAEMGAASYAIYLTHLTCIGIVYKIAESTGLFHKLPVPLMYLVLCGSGVLGGILFSRLVEYPLMRLTRARLFGRPETAKG